MKIVDTFIFYNELDMLYFRLNELYDTVDYFVLVEAIHTFIGNPKPLYYEENKDRFSKFSDKIVHIIVRDMPMCATAWDREYYQRNAIKWGLNELELDYSDCIIISDVDEIPDIDTINSIKRFHVNDVYCLEQDFYYYNLNHRFNNKWYHAKICNKDITDFKTIQEIRNKICSPIIKGGWHFSYFGDAEFISNKIKQFSHQEYNNPFYTNTDKIRDLIKNHKDLFSRDHNPEFIEIEDNKYLPKNYKQLI